MVLRAAGGTPTMVWWLMHNDYWCPTGLQFFHLCESCFTVSHSEINTARRLKHHVVNKVNWDICICVARNCDTQKVNRRTMPRAYFQSTPQGIQCAHGGRKQCYHNSLRVHSMLDNTSTHFFSNEEM